MFEAYFFDFDGTIGNTEADIRQAWLSTLTKLNLPKGNFVQIFRVGPSLPETGAMLFPDLEPDFRDTLHNTYKSFYDDTDNYTAVPYPGLTRLFHDMKSSGKKVYIVTNKRIKPLKKLVDKFDLAEFCHGIFSPDIVDLKQHINKQDLLALASRISGTDPGKSLMIGDTDIDILAGQYCGMKTCGVLWGYGSEAVIKSAKPDYIAKHAEDIPFRKSR